MDRLDVSVFMITYNHEKYIREAVEGILQQQSKYSFELVVGEDCSMDSTREILLEYKEKYPDKIKLLLHEQNVGAMNNQILTLKACTGKYVALCEGDDYWTDPHKLEKQVQWMEAHPEYAICHHKVEILEEGKPVEDWNQELVEETLTITDLAKNNFIHTPSCLFRNPEHDYVPDWFRHVVLGDFALFMVVAQYGKIHHMDDTMAVYRMHKRGLWSNRDKLTRDRQRCQQMLIMADNFENEEVKQILTDKGLKFLTSTVGYLNGQPTEIKLFFDKLLPLISGAGLKIKILEEMRILLHEKCTAPSLSYISKKISLLEWLKIIALKVINLTTGKQ